MTRSRPLIPLLAPLAAALCLASPAPAAVLVGFDTARPMEPQHIEAGAGVVALDSAYGAFAQGRIGLLPELDARLAAGLLLLDEELGFEVDLSGKFRLVPASAAGLDVAFGGELGFIKTADVFMATLDPVAHASRHFPLPGERELWFGVTLGAALSVIDIDGGEDDVAFGFLGGLVAGVDIVQGTAFALDARWRDDVWRLGGIVTLDF